MTENSVPQKKILAVIIAGGKSRRMAGHLGVQNKFLLPFAKDNLLNFMTARLSVQISDIMINANDISQDLGFEVLPDIREEMQGPLSGILTALTVAKERGYEQVLTLACDTPFFPNDFLTRLKQQEAMIVLAHSHGRVHPLMGLWDVSLVADLTDYLDKGQRKVMSFAEKQSPEICAWQDVPYDPFFNINDAEDLEKAQKILKRYF